MSEFLHKLAEGLRSREKMLEDHAENSAFDLPGGNRFKQEYDALLAEIKDFRTQIEKAKSSEKDYDEHFEREINENDQRLSVKIDSWRKSIAP
jgi:hypothetical protein